MGVFLEGRKDGWMRVLLNWMDVHLVELIDACIGKTHIDNNNTH